VGRPKAPAPRRPRYGSFPTTADVGLWARGASPGELFGAMGTGLFALMTDLRRVRATEERAVAAHGADPAALAVAFLTELLRLVDAEGFVGRRVRARVLGSPATSLLATVDGETFDPERHRLRVQVKAATFHRIEVDLDRGRARVILDI
jgi:protein archease